MNSYTEKMRQQERHALILSGAVEDTYSRVNRMLGAPTGMRLTMVHPFHSIHPPAPGWTDGENIYLSAKNNELERAFLSGELTAPQVMALTGLNYHELSHCFFTPPLHGPLANDVRRAGYWMAFNILEDQKVESIFTAKYEHAQHYFTKLVETFLRTSPQQIQSNYALIAGRLFLPPELRKFFKDNFMAPQHVKEIEEIALAYRRERDEKKMFTLIERLSKILQDMQDQMPDGGGLVVPDHTTPGVRAPQPYDPDELEEGDDDEVIGTPTQGGTPAPSGKEGEDEESEQGAGAGEGDSEGDEEGPSQGQGGGGQSSGKGEGEGEDGNGSERDFTPEARDDGNQTDDSGPDMEGGGSGAGHGQRASQKDLEAQLDQMLDKVSEAAQSEVASELRKQQQTIRSNTKNFRLPKEQRPRTTVRPTPQDNQIVQKVVREFRALERRHKPGWHRKQNTGVLDANRLHRIKDHQYDVFRKWREGANKLFAYEITLLIDTSGSMSGAEMEAASKAAWHLHKAFDELNAKVTVIGYSSDTFLFMDRSDQVPKRIPIYGASGGTHAGPALEAASAYHHTSRLDKHICFLITDGGFADSGAVQEQFDSFGFPIILIGIGDGASQTIKFYGDQVRASRYRWLRSVALLTKAEDLVAAIKEYVLNQAKESVR